MWGSTPLTCTHGLPRCCGKADNPNAAAALRLSVAAPSVSCLAGLLLVKPSRFGQAFHLLAKFGSGAKLAFKTPTPHGNPRPRYIHTDLHFYPFHTGRLIIIGDVHGCALELAQLLVKLKYDKTRDRLVFVGDLVNKGPDSLKVMRLVMTAGAAVVRGNHDDSALSAYNKLQRRQATIQDVPQNLRWVKAMRPQEAAFLKDLPFTIRVPSHHLLIVHAGLVPERSKSRQNLVDLFSMREITHTAPGEYNSCQPGAGEPWASRWQGPDHIIFGHDAKRGLQKYPYATGLDTGCVYGRSLTACVMPIVLPEALGKNLASAPTLDMLKAELMHLPAVRQYAGLAK